MTEQSLESLTAMRLMPRDKNIPTELIAVRDAKKKHIMRGFLPAEAI